MKWTQTKAGFKSLMLELELTWKFHACNRAWSRMQRYRSLIGKAEGQYEQAYAKYDVACDKKTKLLEERIYGKRKV